MKVRPRYVVAVRLLLLAAIAYEGSAIAGKIAAARLLPAPVLRLDEPMPAPSRAPKQPENYYAVIYKRDIFNSTKPAPEPPQEPPRMSALQLRLWGVALHHDGRSSCIIEDLETTPQALYRIGDTVHGDARISGVQWDRVVLAEHWRKNPGR